MVHPRLREGSYLSAVAVAPSFNQLDTAPHRQSWKTAALIFKAHSIAANNTYPNLRLDEIFNVMFRYVTSSGSWARNTW